MGYLRGCTGAKFFFTTLNYPMFQIPLFYMTGMKRRAVNQIVEERMISYLCPKQVFHVLENSRYNMLVESLIYGKNMTKFWWTFCKGKFLPFTIESYW